MTTKEAIIAALIHLVVPLSGLVWFFLFRKKMLKELQGNAPTLEYFLLFGTYGGLLISLLTILFWKWSGMASLGGLYLSFVAPIVMAAIAYIHSKQRKVSKYSLWAFRLGIGYFLAAPIVFGSMYVVAYK